jgi:hypothetical protein
MARYFLTSQKLTLECGTVHVEMVSKPDEHLWLLWTTHAPGVNPRRDTRSNTTVPHQSNFNLYIEGIVEQEEAGITRDHNFRFTLPLHATTIWFYTINLGRGGNKATRSAIFAYNYHPVTIMQENWLGFPINPLFHWTGMLPQDGSITDANGMLTARGVASHTSNVPVLGYANLSLEPLMQNIEPCGVNFSFSIDQNIPGFAKYSATVQIDIRALDTGDIYAFQFTTALPGDFRSTWPLRAAGNAAIALVDGPQTVDLRLLLTDPPGIRGGPFTPYPSGPITVLAVGLGTYQQITQLPSPMLQSYGPLNFANTNIQLTDISATWKGTRIHPILP